MARAGPPDGRGGGSVARCGASASVPAVRKTSAVASPATGSTRAASNVTMTGPAMKIASSSTDSSEYAACSSGVPWSRCAHRARTSGPTGRYGRAGHGRREQQDADRAALGDQDERDQCGCFDGQGAQQHRPLAYPVDESGQGGLGGRLDEGVGRRHPSGQGIGVPPRLDEQHDADPHHRDRQAHHEAGRREGCRPRQAQDVGVGVPAARPDRRGHDTGWRTTTPPAWCATPSTSGGRPVAGPVAGGRSAIPGPARSPCPPGSSAAPPTRCPRRSRASRGRPRAR